MKFLWLTKDIPMRADSGSHIYSNGLIRSLCATGATGTLITYASSEAPPHQVPGLTVRSVNLPRRFRPLSLLSKLQSSAYQLEGAAFARLLREEMAKNPDAIVIDYFAMGWVLPIVQEAMRGLARKPVLVYVSHNYEPSVRREVANSERNGLFRAILRLDAEKGARLDRSLAEAVALILANTDEDNRAYAADVPGKHILTLTPAYDGEIAPTRAIDLSTPRRVVMTGTFDWIAKQRALRRFVSAAEIPFQRAGIDLLVVGRCPTAIVDELSARSRICKFTGWVEDVRPHLAGARIGIMPDEVGGGFKHKYLYYIFSGLPIATIRSQVAGLPVNIDEDLIARETHAEIVQEIIAAIDDIPRLNGMRERCYQACATAFSWSDRGVRLAEAIESLCAARQSLVA